MHITHHDDNQINISYLCIRTFTKINQLHKLCKNKKIKTKHKKKKQQKIDLSLNSGKLKTREMFCSV